MSRLIDADAVPQEFLEYEFDGKWRGCTIKDLLDSQPTIDAEQVVRCKDCKWWDRIDNGPYGYCHSCKHCFYSANWEISIYRRYKEDWFCAYGERITDGRSD